MAGRGAAAGVRETTPARATDREVVVVAAVLLAGSEKAAAHHLGLSHSTVKHPSGTKTRSCRVHILVDEPTEEISPFDVGHAVSRFDGSKTLGYPKI